MTLNEKENIEFEALIDSFSFDCWAVNRDMVYTYQNRKSIENWGNVLGKSVDELSLCREAKSIWKKQLKKVFKGEKITIYYGVETQDKYFHSTITPLKKDNKYIGALGATIDITELKDNEIKLAKRKKELEQLNTALHVLLDKREKDKVDNEKKLVKKIQVKLLPLVERLKKTCNGNNKKIIDSLENKLRQFQLISPDNLKEIFSHTEIQVVSFIREGNSSKEIACILNISKSTVDTHRDNIRRKLGLKNSQQKLKNIL